MADPFVSHRLPGYGQQREWPPLSAGGGGGGDGTSKKKRLEKSVCVPLLTRPSTVHDLTQSHYGEALSQLVLANIMATADFDGDGHVSPEEFVRICLQNEALFEDGPCVLCVQ